RLRFSGPKTSIIRTPTTSLKTSIKTITNLSDTNCLEIQGASLMISVLHAFNVWVASARFVRGEPICTLMQ
ncbi:hypothetical protein C7B73_12880, partial [Enterobacter hormaechei]